MIRLFIVSLFVFTFACSSDKSSNDDPPSLEPQEPQLCANIDCGANGSCAVQNGAAICACDAGFHPVGLSCEANFVSQCIDADSDSYGVNCPAGDDCDDTDVNAFVLHIGYEDIDNDGFGYGAVQNICAGVALPNGYAVNDQDCDPLDPLRTTSCVTELSYTLRVDPINGDDTFTYAQVRSDPDNFAWATVARAMMGIPASGWNGTDQNQPTTNSAEAAQAGDTVLVEPGAYSIDRDGVVRRSIFSYFSVNQGTAENPIIYRARYRAAYLTEAEDSLRSKLEHTNGAGTVLLLSGDYIYWDGFYVNEDTSIGQSEWIIEIGGGTRGGLVFSDLLGPSDENHPMQYDNNHAILGASRFTMGVEKLILSNKFRRHYTNGGIGDPNEAAVVLYDQIDIYFLHNEFDDIWGGGIFIKADNEPGNMHGGIYAFNIFKNIPGRGFEMYNSHFNRPLNDTFVYQNLFYNVTTGIRFGRTPDGYSSGYAVVNNTFDSSDFPDSFPFEGAIFYGNNTPENNVFYNNLITNIVSSGTTDPVYTTALSFGEDWFGLTLSTVEATTGLDFDRNYYANINGDNIVMFEDAHHDLAYWQDDGAGFGHNSIYNSSADGIYSAVADRDYSLSPTSPVSASQGPCLDYLQRLGGAVTASIDCGAYIEGINEVPGLQEDYDYSWHYNGLSMPRDARF